MTNHAEIAKQLFFKGYNCAQSVFCAFSDLDACVKPAVW